MRYTVRRLEESPWEQLCRWCGDVPEWVWSVVFAAILIACIMKFYGLTGAGL